MKYKNEKLTILSFLRYLSLVFLFVIIGGLIGIKSSQSHIKREFSNYKSIIREAKFNDNLIYQGTITKFKKNDDYYYVFFKIKKEDNTNAIIKSSLTYSEDECNYYRENPNVLVAKDRNSETYVFMDFENKKIEDYKSYKKSCKAEGIFSSLTIAFSILLIITSIFSKKNKGLNDLAKPSYPRNNQVDTIENANSNHKYCDYCGEKIPEDSHKCPNCGASINRKKEI